MQIKDILEDLKENRISIKEAEKNALVNLRLFFAKEKR